MEGKPDFNDLFLLISERVDALIARELGRQPGIPHAERLALSGAVTAPSKRR